MVQTRLKAAQITANWDWVKIVELFYSKYLWIHVKIYSKLRTSKNAFTMRSVSFIKHTLEKIQTPSSSFFLVNLFDTINLKSYVEKQIT